MEPSLEFSIYQFCDILQKCKLEIDNDHKKVMEKMYSQFTYNYYNFSFIPNDEMQKFTKNLFNFLYKNKFITYHVISKKITNNDKSLSQLINENKKFANDFLSNDFIAVFCVENQCYIFESIDIIFLSNILKKLKTSIIETNTNDDLLKEEIKSFNDHFKKDINKNKFFKYTFNPIVTYLTRRFFCPSDYFKDQSFFIFDKQNKKSDKELIKNKISDFNHSKYLESIVDKGKKLKYEVNKEIINQKIEKKYLKTRKFMDFDEKDFIELRPFYTTEKFYHILVMHLPTLYIFAMKKVFCEFKRENYFCKNYFNRCFVPFYGFMKNNGKVTGFIYEYMSQGNLYDYVKNTKNNINSIFALTAVLRMYQSLSFLESNTLIHRDLKPANILIDHDNMIYISDFETIRPIDDGKFTNDIGAMIYASPEQNNGKALTIATDIYSFGKLIYFIYAKIDYTSSYELENCSQNIISLYHKCINDNPNDRPSIMDIKKVLLDETISNFNLKEYLANDNIQQISKDELSHYFFENINIRLQSDDKNEIMEYIKKIVNFYSVVFLVETSHKNEQLVGNIDDYNDKIIQNYSNLLIELGDIFLTNEKLDKKILLAKECYELAAKDGNSLGLLKLGDLYFMQEEYDEAIRYYELAAEKGNSLAFLKLGDYYFAEKDFTKAIYYYELAAGKSNSDALLKLGNIYFNGLSVESDFITAKGYYELASSEGNHEAQSILGNYYRYGFIDEPDFQIARHFYELSAEGGNTEALYNLGDFYENGIGVNRYYGKALDYYELAAKKNYSDAIFKLGYFYEKGLGILVNYEKAKYYYLSAGAKNNSTAYYNLGNMYEKGIGVEKNYDKAKEYYELSANYNNSIAYLKLGDIYHYKKYDKIDYVKAKEMYEIAAKLKNSDALLRISDLYLHGLGVEKDIDKVNYYCDQSLKLGNGQALVRKNYYHSFINATNKIFMNIIDISCFAGSIYELFDYNKYKNIQPSNITNAIEYFTSLADQGFVIFQLILSDFYSQGFGVKKDLKMAKKYLKMAAKKNIAVAFWILGSLYKEEENYQKAKKYYKLCIKHKSRMAFVSLGELYEKGLGVEQDYIKAKELYELAAKNNISEGLVKLGDLYFKGNGIERNYFKAKEYYELAAKMGNDDAYLVLGFLYSEGKGCSKNFLKSKNYYELAAQRNNSKAFFFLGKIYYIGQGVEKNYEKAKKYFELAAEQNIYLAFYYLGIIYYDGLGVKTNYLEAKYYFEIAANNNVTSAILYLGYLYSEGFGVEKNYKKAIEYFEIAAQKNDDDAPLVLGFLYENGYIVKKIIRKP